MQIIVHFLFLQSKKLREGGGGGFPIIIFLIFYVCDGCDLFNALVGLGGFLLVYFACCVTMYSVSVGWYPRVVFRFLLFVREDLGIYFLCGFFVLSLLI